MALSVVASGPKRQYTNQHNRLGACISQAGNPCVHAIVSRAPLRLGRIVVLRIAILEVTGAGEGIRTLDPDLGKSVFPFNPG